MKIKSIKSITLKMPFSHGGNKVIFHGKEWKELEFNLVRVETETLSEIMNKFDFPEYIHLLDIDVEYADYDVLIGCNWEKHRFGAILVELNNELVEKKMKKEGYNMYLQFKEGSKDRLYIDSKNKKLEEKVKKINKTIRDEKGRIVHWEIGVLQK